MNEMSRNHMAVVQLSLLGFPLSNIRLSLHKLTGITQPMIARTIGVYRLKVTNHMAGNWKNRDTQAKIAGVFDIPVDVLFEDTFNHD